MLLAPLVGLVQLLEEDSLPLVLEGSSDLLQILQPATQGCEATSNHSGGIYSRTAKHQVERGDWASSLHILATTCDTNGSAINN